MLGTAIRIIGGLIKIVGNTTGIPIGNVLDALKVNLRDSSGAEIGTLTNPLVVNSPDIIVRPQENIFITSPTVPPNISTSLGSYTVVFPNTAYIERIAVSGENVAKYSIYVNNILVDSQYTFYGALNTSFEFISRNSFGFPVMTGDSISVEVLHAGPGTGEFNARLQFVLIS